MAGERTPEELQQKLAELGMSLTDPIEIAPGEFRQLGTCTREEIGSAMDLIDARSAVLTSEIALHDEAVRLMKKHGVGRLGDIPPDVLQRESPELYARLDAVAVIPPPTL